MTTRLYLPSSGTAPISVAMDTVWDTTALVTPRPTSTTKGTSAFTEISAVETSTSTSHDIAFGQYISPPLSAQTISGTLQARVRSRQSDVDANARSQFVARVVSNDGSVVRGTLIGSSTTTAAVNQWGVASSITEARTARYPRLSASSTVTSVVCEDGDRLVFEFGVRAINTVSTPYTYAVEFGENSPNDLPANETDTSQAAPWIEFSGDLLFKAASTGINLIGTWTQVGTGTASVNATTKAVTISPAGDGTPCAMRQQITTEIGMTYWWTFELQTTSTSMWRAIGTTAGGTDIFGLNVATNPETKLVFTATTTSVWLELTRTSSGTTRTGNHRFEKAPPGSSKARRINGVNQYFKLDVAAAGLRTSNSLQYIGGWFKWQYVPTSMAYLLDWAVPDLTTTGGGQRARIFYDPTVPKIAASSSGSAANGNRYMEDAHAGTPTADEWRYIGISLAANGAVSCVYNGAINGTSSGTAPDIGNYLTVLHLGSRNNTTASGFAPAIYADWVWCAGFVPTNAQLTELMGGKRVTDVTGFAPTYYWPLEGTTTVESSTAGVADLTANTQPGNVVGPPYAVPVVISDEIPPLLMF